MPLVQQYSGPYQVYWLATCFELQLEILTALEAQRGQEASIALLKTSEMNRLQRSLVSGRVQTVAGDSTINVSTFLTTTLNSINGYLKANPEADEEWKVSTLALSKNIS